MKVVLLLLLQMCLLVGLYGKQDESYMKYVTPQGWTQMAYDLLFEREDVEEYGKILMSARKDKFEVVDSRYDLVNTLCCMARDNNVEALGILLSNVDYDDEDKCNALVYAIRDGNIDAVRYFLEKSGLVGGEGLKCQLPSFFVASLMNEEMVELLRDKGVEFVDTFSGLPENVEPVTIPEERMGYLMRHDPRIRSWKSDNRLLDMDRELSELARHRYVLQSVLRCSDDDG